MSRSEYVNVIREIALENDLKFSSFSHDWIIRIDRGLESTFIFGYYFDINPSASSEICKEKPATSEVLKQANICHIEHAVFLNPGHPLTEGYVSSSGSLTQLFEFCSVHRNDVVVKPLKGTGGLDVVRARNRKEIETAVLSIFAKELGVAVSPYVELGDEYRVICLNGEARLIYRKKRAEIIGDGSQTVSQLIIQYMRNLSDPRGVAKCLAECKDYNHVLHAGETLPIQWKHNLGLGLSEVQFDIESSLQLELKVIARKAVSSLGMKFCSVDIAQKSLSNDLIVVEVNAGVMMDVFMKDPARRNIAKEIYKEAILASFKQYTVHGNVTK